jgi:HlyD family secretion protein
MDSLEGTTVDLIYRRRVRSSGLGFMAMIMVTAIAAGLPLVKVDLVSNAHGMIRPMTEPAEIMTTITGLVDSTLLKDHLAVEPGDTLIWLCRAIPESRMKTCREQIRDNQGPMDDIRAILAGKPPSATSRIMQSHRNHLALGESLVLDEGLMRKEYEVSLALYEQEVIPRLEYEQVRSGYMVARARVASHRENYRSVLEEELFRLEEENRRLKENMEQVSATLKDYYVISPASGLLRQCPGIGVGSAVHPGTRLGVVTSSDQLVAECYVVPGEISRIRPGTLVKLRFQIHGRPTSPALETRVSTVDPDVVVMEGSPVYRVRCNLDHLNLEETRSGPIRPGMTFSASMVLDRVSLAFLLLERVNRRVNPALAGQIPISGDETGM